MSHQVYIGIDLGTTAVKACAFTHQGRLLKSISQAYPLHQIEPGAAEQDPDELVAAAATALKKLLAEIREKPAGIGISTAMHSLLLLSPAGDPVSPLITWADTRAVAVMPDFPPDLIQYFHQQTGTPVHPMSPLVKLRWIQKAHPAWLVPGYRVADIKSYLVHCWTNDGLLIDCNLASATGLYATNSWDEKAVRFAGITMSALPKVVPPDYALNWRPTVATALGTTTIPLYIGGSDGCLANLGSGLLSPGDVALSIGTSGAVRATHQQATIDPSLGLFNYQLYDDYFVIGGATNNGAKALEWVFNLLQHPWQNIGEMIDAASKKTAEGLQFTPYLYGERAPIWDANATASFTGIRGFHQAPHYARAVLEGITNNVATLLQQLEKATGPSQRIIASGGFTKSPFWVELLTERTGRQVVLTEAGEASAWGAALMAKKGREAIADLPALILATK